MGLELVLRFGVAGHCRLKRVVVGRIAHGVFGVRDTRLNRPQGGKGQVNLLANRVFGVNRCLLPQIAHAPPRRKSYPRRGKRIERPDQTWLRRLLTQNNL